MTSSNIEIVTDNNFSSAVLQSSEPVLIDFWATWCGPCKMLTPIVADLANEYKGRLRVGKINVDENSQVPSQYRIMSIPTLLLFKDGEVKGRLVGYQPKAHLVKLVESVI